MVLDTIAFSYRYTSLHPLFERAFRFLAESDLRSFSPGRHPVDGDRLYLVIDHVEGRGRDGARLESHRRYIDIQYTLDGHEEIGWMPVSSCGPMAESFDEARDVGFFDTRPASWLLVPPGTFAVFFPHDAHAPLAGRGALKKAIMKVAVEAG
jgi:biofilm protein TabA